MSSLQRIVKYIAIAFALFLAFSIISGIMSGILLVGNIFGNHKDNSIIENAKVIEISDNILSLDVQLNSSNIVIKKGEKFKVETNNTSISWGQDNQKLTVTDRSSFWFDEDDSKVIIYIPEDKVLDSTYIVSGAGKLEISDLTIKDLKLELGAGKVNIYKLNVINETEIDGGAGEVIIEDSSFSNLDLSMGIGNFSLKASLFGDSEIDHGVGNADVYLLGSNDDYQIHVDKGIGSVIVDGNKVTSDTVIGNGSRSIDIDGGIGNIKIDFE